ncbi:MAG: tRNA pseudouridine(55) synthase TruB [Caldisericia bacterium]|jgi:tRNA pseudouridine55 synthase|nr:tRNA pseudouridine(55) synthase TruB [Caldisericia bacterium]
MKELFSGIINSFKPPGITSFQFMSIIKKLCKFKKVGHGGILDFMAQGVLPILVGEATKLTPLLFLLPKEYEGEITFGIKTDSDDIWGNVLEERDSSYLTIREIEKIKGEFIGRIFQVPPQFSAKRISGERAYEIARRGEVVPLKEQEVEIYQFEIIDFMEGKYPKLKFKILCSSGTYMRSLARDMGEKLGTFGILSYLIRSAVGKLEVKDSFHLDEIEDYVLNNKIDNLIISISNFLDFIPKVQLPQRKLTLFINGSQIKYEHPFLKGGYVLVVNGLQEAVGIGKYIEDRGILKPVRILKSNENL